MIVKKQVKQCGTQYSPLINELLNYFLRLYLFNRKSLAPVPVEILELRIHIISRCFKICYHLFWYLLPFCYLKI
nr:MAG TPA: hypothetical protein [Caudoviricetes sp.]